MGATAPIGKKLKGQQSQCAACGEYFKSVKCFERHQRGRYPRLRMNVVSERHCLNTAQMQKRGWSTNAHGFWVMKKRSPKPAPLAQERRSPDDRHLSTGYEV
jgi:hypothetical protein